jgi:hypothetical protein
MRRCCPREHRFSNGWPGLAAYLGWRPFLMPPELMGDPAMAEQHAAFRQSLRPAPVGLG